MQLIQSINHKKIPTNSSFNQSITKNTNIPLIQSINNNIPTYSSFNQSITKNTCSRQEVAKIGEGIQKKNLDRNLSEPFTTWSSFDTNTSEIFKKCIIPISTDEQQPDFDGFGSRGGVEEITINILWSTDTSTPFKFIIFTMWFGSAYAVLPYSHSCRIRIHNTAYNVMRIPMDPGSASASMLIQISAIFAFWIWIRFLQADPSKVGLPLYGSVRLRISFHFTDFYD